MQEHLLTDMTPFIALSILLWVIMANKELIEAHHTNRENEAKCFRVDTNNIRIYMYASQTNISNFIHSLHLMGAQLDSVVSLSQQSVVAGDTCSRVALL